MQFAELQWVHLFWVAAVIVGCLVWLELRQRAVLARFVSVFMQRRLASAPGRGSRTARLVCISMAVSLCILGLMRPQTRGAQESFAGARASADVMVVLDTSRSMLADDAAPSRLTRAKAEISDLAGKLRHHRVGLIAFAGRASVLSPPTTDAHYLRTVLEDVSTDTVGRGGTRIGLALRTAAEALGPGDGAKLVLLITDGEDHDSYPEEAARELRDAGIRVVAIGLGSEEGSALWSTDPDTGARRPIVDGAGTQVVSRLDGALLRSIAETTRGAYVPARTAVLDLESIVSELIEPLVRDAARVGSRVIPGEQYPWFALAAMLCVFLAAFFGARVRRRWPL